jgi:integrase
MKIDPAGIRTTDRYPGRRGVSLSKLSKVLGQASPTPAKGRHTSHVSTSVLPQLLPQLLIGGTSPWRAFDSRRRGSRRPRGREELRDLGAPGLVARGGPRGWTFSVRVGPRGSQRRIALGVWSPVHGLGTTLKEARVKVAQLAGRAAETPSAKPSETVDALVEEFLLRRYPKNVARRKKVKALLKNHALHTIGDLGVRQVTRAHCGELVSATQRTGRSPAVELVRVLRQLFRHAVKTGRLETLAHSPAELLEPRDFGIGDAESRRRFLGAEELATLFLHVEVDLPGILAGRPGPEWGLSLSVRAAIVLGPHLAVRPAALVGLRWDEVDLVRAVATIGGGRGGKQKFGTRPRAFAVPLSSTALAVLETLKASAATAWVFPSRSRTGHLSGDVLADAMLRLSSRIQLPGGAVRPHDARRTFTATAERLGISKLVVDRVLQHSLGKVGDTYFVGDDAETRRKAHELVDALWTAIRAGVPATVVPIGRASR